MKQLKGVASFVNGLGLGKVVYVLKVSHPDYKTMIFVTPDKKDDLDITPFDIVYPLATDGVRIVSLVRMNKLAQESDLVFLDGVSKGIYSFDGKHLHNIRRGNDACLYDAINKVIISSLPKLAVKFRESYNEKFSGISDNPMVLFRLKYIGEFLANNEVKHMNEIFNHPEAIIDTEQNTMFKIFMTGDSELINKTCLELSQSTEKAFDKAARRLNKTDDDNFIIGVAELININYTTMRKFIK